jgi:hypothetical protein
MEPIMIQIFWKLVTKQTSYFLVQVCKGQKKFLKNFSILLSGTKQAWWCGATGVPDACFPTVELDVGVLEKFVGHEVVDCSNSIGLDDGVKIV